MSGTTNFGGLMGNVFGQTQQQMYQPQMPAYPYSGGMSYGGYHPMNPYMSGSYRPMMQPNYWNQMAYGMAGLPSYGIPQAGSYYAQPAMPSYGSAPISGGQGSLYTRHM